MRLFRIFGWFFEYKIETQLPVPTKNSIHEQLPLLYQRKIKLRAGTHGEDHRHVELPRPFPVLAVQLIVVPDSAYRETRAFSPHDNRYCRISVAAADAVHLL
jgi:hypothetical protein